MCVWLFCTKFCCDLANFFFNFELQLGIEIVMKRDKTWRIGRSSKKWSAMNFRASAWSNRNLATWRKIFNYIPSIWVKKKELIWGNMFQRNVAATNSGLQVSFNVRKWAWDMLKRRSKVSIKGQCRLSGRLSVLKKDGGPAAWCWVETGLLRGAHDRGRWMTWVALPQEASHTFACCSSFRTTACAAGFKDFLEFQERQLQVDHWVWLEVTGAGKVRRYR